MLFKHSCTHLLVIASFRDRSLNECFSAAAQTTSSAEPAGGQKQLRECGRYTLSQWLHQQVKGVEPASNEDNVHVSLQLSINQCTDVNKD